MNPTNPTHQNPTQPNPFARPNPVEAQQLDALLNELRAAQDLCLLLEPVVAYTLIGQLQLALRHPLNKGKSSRVARALIETWRDRLCAPGSLLWNTIENGFNPRYDCTLQGLTEIVPTLENALQGQLEDRFVTQFTAAMDRPPNDAELQAFQKACAQGCAPHDAEHHAWQFAQGTLGPTSAGATNQP